MELINKNNGIDIFTSAKKILALVSTNSLKHVK